MSSQKKESWSPVPPPMLNGGLYTGQPFIEGAPWANVPVRPTSSYMTNVALRSANPPIQAMFQLQSGYRPGNNSDDPMPGIMGFVGDKDFGPFNFPCLPCFKRHQIQEPPCKIIQIV